MPSLKMHMEAYLDACGIVLARYKGPRMYYYCSNPNCHVRNLVQGMSRVWPCGANYGGKPCRGQYYVWKHHAAAITAEAKSRDPNAERIRALREKREREATENMPVSLTEITGQKLVPLSLPSLNEKPTYYAGQPIAIWRPPTYTHANFRGKRADIHSFDSFDPNSSDMHSEYAASPIQPNPSVDPRPSHKPSSRPEPQPLSRPTSPKTTVTKSMPDHKTHHPASGGGLPSSKEQKHAAVQRHSPPTKSKTINYPAEVKKESHRALKEEKEPLPPKLPPKDPHRVPKAQPLTPSKTSSKQQNLTGQVQNPLRVHYRTDSSQSPIAAVPLSPKQHSSSRYAGTPSTQPVLSNAMAPAPGSLPLSTKQQSSPCHMHTPSTQYIPSGSVLPAPGSLAKRAASPPPLHWRPCMQHGGIPSAHPARF